MRRDSGRIDRTPQPDKFPIKPETQCRIAVPMKRGFQTRNAEMDLDRMLGELVEQ